MPISISDKVTTNTLIVFGYNKVYYGGTNVPPTFTELTTTGLEIDTSDQLTSFEGFQKRFVVNGAKLYVADFINTKLTHSALTTAHAHGDILTQAVTGATMVVDFTDTAKTHTYGFVTSGTFTATANDITGSGSGTTFQATAVTAPKHWYAWTVYSGGASGSMPAKAYLGCLYRGRCVLSGNPNYPFQWYMSRTANPWDWLYAANDAMSPVAGGNADAGQLGDVIRALIPYKDEYLVMGCANSMWVLRGDPACGGSIESIDLTIGIFGEKSWCFDGAGNLYFLSKSGLNMIPANLGGVQPISQPVLPNFSTAEALDPAIHRVTLAYDPDSYGIVICITTLATGVNSNYFYDLRTQGLFPETYPTSCGVYSAFYYNANDDTTRGLLLGGADGYIRCFSKTEKNDVGTGADSIITSHCTLPIIQNDDDDRELRMTSLTITTAGGESGGTEGDTDGVTVNVYSADSAEAVLEAIEDGDTPQSITTLSGVGRNNRIRDRVRGHSLAVELKNSTTDQTWAIERVAADVESVGKVKQ